MYDRKQQFIDAAKELGTTCDFDGIITPGDMYLAKRNGPVQLLTCKAIEPGFIVPVEPCYCFDIHDCVRIKQ